MSTEFDIHEASITHAVSVCPAPDRMYAVFVYEGESDYFIYPLRVVAIRCEVETHWSKRRESNCWPSPGCSPASMRKQGWNHEAGPFPREKLVVLTDGSEGPPELLMLEDFRIESKPLGYWVVIADWPPERDEEEFQRIAKNIIDKDPPVGFYKLARPLPQPSNP